MKLRLKKLLLVTVFLGMIHLPSAPAQEAAVNAGGSQRPVMYSVFWNTLWGSAWGATMGISYHLVSGIKFRESVITGTTIGGMLGYGLGIYLVINGLSFDKAYLLELPAPKFGPQQPNANLWETETAPIHARRKKPDPSKWEIPLFTFHF